MKTQVGSLVPPVNARTALMQGCERPATAFPEETGWNRGRGFPGILGSRFMGTGPSARNRIRGQEAGGSRRRAGPSAGAGKMSLQ